MRTSRRAAVAAAITALAVSACGSSSHSSSDSASSKQQQLPIVVVRTKGQVLALVKLTIKQKPYMFIVDTGALKSTLDISAARALKLPDAGKASSTKSLCKITQQPVRVSDWKLGSAALPAEVTQATKTAYAGIKLGGVPFGGSLGSDLLSRFGTVTLDLADGKMILGGTAPSGTTTIPLSVRRTHGQVVVLADAKVAGRSTKLVFDTGAGRTDLDAVAAKPFHLPAAGKAVTTKTAFCSKQTFQPLKLSDWSVGPMKMPDIVAPTTRDSIVESAHGKVLGLLGLDQFASYKTVSIDFDAQKLVLSHDAPS